MLRAALQPPRNEKLLQKVEIGRTVRDGRVTAQTETHRVSGVRLVVATSVHIIWTERFATVKQAFDAIPRILADNNIFIDEPAATLV